MSVKSRETGSLSSVCLTSVDVSPADALRELSTFLFLTIRKRFWQAPFLQFLLLCLHGCEALACQCIVKREDSGLKAFCLHSKPLALKLIEKLK